MRHIHTCPHCHSYTLEDSCPQCTQQTILARPPKYSPEDKYGEYRRKAKELSHEHMEN